MLTKIHARLFLLSSILILCTIQFSACSPQVNTATELPPVVLDQPTDTAPSPGPLKIADGLDREITLDEPAQRVVSLAPSNTEILFAIGAGEQVLARDEFSDFPTQASDLPSVGGGFGDYNLEAIVALQPDLVLAAEINTPEQVKALEDLGLTVFFLPNPTSLEEMYQNLVTVAMLTGHSDDADELVEDLRDRVTKVEEEIHTSVDRPAVFYELDATDPSAPWTAGAGTFINTLIVMAGGENIATDLEGDYLQISVEELLVRDPQVILLGDAAYGVSPESVKERIGWSNINALSNDRIYSFDDNLVSRPGPRLVDGLEQLAMLIHPEVYQE
jgi:iron complex transport system substrate-binding protein